MVDNQPKPAPLDPAEIARRLKAAAEAQAKPKPAAAADDGWDKAAADANAGKAPEPPPKPERGTPEWADALIEEHAARRFDPDNPPPELDPIFTVNAIPVLTPGNFAILCGQAGTAKSHCTGATIAATVTPRPDEVDCLGWAARNPAGKALIYLDFEQSPQDFHKLLKSACRRAGIDKPPPWLMAYNLTGRDPGEGKDFLRAALLHARARFGGTYAALVDGIADLAATVNDEAEAIALVRELHAAAIEFQTGILGILHLNPASDFKTRGHLGSQSERKAETVLTLKREQATAIITASTHKARHRPIPENEGPRFAWDDDWGGFRSAQSRQSTRHAATELKAARLARDLFAVEQAFTHGDACRRIEELEGVNHDAAKKRLAKLRGLELVTVEPATGLYRLGDAAREDSATSETVNLDPLLRSINR